MASPTIITNTDPGNFQSDGVYTDIVAAAPAPYKGPPTALYALVGGANDGEPGIFTPFTDSPSAIAAFGNDTISPNSLLRAALSAMPECQAFGAVRVVDGTDVPATITVGGGGIPASASMEVVGTPHTGQSLTTTFVNGATTVTVGPMSIHNSDTTVTVATRMAALINASAAVTGPTAFLSQATTAGPFIMIQALVPGTAGNSITDAGSTSTSNSNTISINPTTAAPLAGGTNSSGTAFILTRNCSGSRANNATAQCYLQSGTLTNSPVFTLIITYPQAPSETFTGIIGYATLGGAFDNTTFYANLFNVVNGLQVGVAGSTRWTLSLGSSAQSPVSTVTQATGGTDGTAGLTTALLIGTDGITGRLGMYALRYQISAAQFAIAGLTDDSVAQTLQTFATQENAIAHFSYPEGTSTEDALGLRASADIAGASLITDMDWDDVYDSISGGTFYVPPQDKIAGVISGCPAYIYPGNQPPNGVSGILTTDHIVGGVNTVGKAEADIRQSNGLLYLGYMPRATRGPALGLPHGLMSDGVTPISDARMLKLIVDVLWNRLGVVIGQGMNTDPTSPDFLNPARQMAQDIADSYLGGLKANKQITNYQFLFGSDNTQTTAQQGFLIPRTSVTTLSPAQYILNIVQVGRTVQILVQAAPAP